jgi:hypothetical protein
MATINFPTNPATNEQYTFEGKTWTFNGTAWLLTGTNLTVKLDSAYDHANAAFDKANTVTSQGEGPFPFIDLGYIYEDTGPAPANFDCGTL